MKPPKNDFGSHLTARKISLALSLEDAAVFGSLRDCRVIVSCGYMDRSDADRFLFLVANARGEAGRQMGLTIEQASASPGSGGL